jgi:hypothetical protein
MSPPDPARRKASTSACFCGHCISKSIYLRSTSNYFKLCGCYEHQTTPMPDASTGQIFDIAGALAFVVRWAVLISSTILIVFGAWLLLSLLWRDDKAISIRPFIVIDPSGKMKSAENGFAQILSVLSTELEAKNAAARALLSSAASAQMLKPQSDALNVPDQSIYNKLFHSNPELKQQRPNLRPMSPLEAAKEKVEVKVEGVDVPGVISWMKSQLIPARNGLAFTAHISEAGKITIAGDIGDMKIDGLSTLYQSSEESPIEALDELAWRLFQLRMTDDDPHLRDLAADEFQASVASLRQAAVLLAQTTPQAEDRDRYKDLSGYFASLLTKHGDWPAMMILAGETARLAGDYDTAVKYFTSALNHEKSLVPGKQNKDRAKLIADSLKVATNAEAAQQQTQVSLTKLPELIKRRVLDDAEDAAELQKLRSGFQALYATAGNGGYLGIAGLHGVPGWYSWNHGRNSRSTANLNLFLPWLRAYILNFERAARAKVPDFALMCWDWTKGGIPKSFAVAKLPDGSANPLAAAFIDLPQAKPPIRRLTTRNLGAPGDLPTPENVSDALKIDSWREFSAALETLSDIGHGWTGGDMGIVTTTSYDPLYYAHSCNVDRLWAAWQETHKAADGSSAIDPALLDVVLDPFGIKVRDVLDTRTLGYTYQ